jgi:N-acetylglutamate synthase-like GNAT family acetyltransferase
VTVRYEIRPALPSEAAHIRRLIWQVGINPFGLDWRRFLVAVDEQGTLIACGQVKPHRDGACELASIAVRAEERGYGIASAVIRRLLAENPPPLYLICRPDLQPFYARFGFAPLTQLETPPSFHWMRQFFALAVMVKRD